MVDRLGFPVWNSPNRLTFKDQPPKYDKFAEWLAACPCNWIRTRALTDGRIDYRFFTDQPDVEGSIQKSLE